MKIVGNKELIDSVKAAYILATARAQTHMDIPTHLLIIGPPGTGKTLLVKQFAEAMGAPFHRTQGNPSLLPDDFIGRNEVVFDENGRPHIKYHLIIEKLRAQDGKPPTIWFIDELDKIPTKSLNALLEIMAEQKTTTPDGEEVKLNCMVIATANTKEFVKEANEIPRTLRDRFVATTRTGYLTMEEDFKILEGFCRNQNENSLEVFTLPPNAVERFLEELRRVPDTVGKCIIELVKKLQENENVEEPPGPRAEIATAAVYTALRVIGYSEEDALKTAIKLCVAPKLTAKNTLELVFREYENCPSCTGIRVEQTERQQSQESNQQEQKQGSTQKPQIGKSEKPSIFPREQIQNLVDKVAKLTGATKAITPLGETSYTMAAQMLRTKKINECTVGGVKFRAIGDFVGAFPVHPSAKKAVDELKMGAGRESRFELTSAEVKDFTELSELLRDYGFHDIGQILQGGAHSIGKVLMGENLRRQRGIQVRARGLKLLFDAFAAQLTTSLEQENFPLLEPQKFTSTGEFHSIDEEKNRLDAVRTVNRFVNYNYRPLYREFAEAGKHIVIAIDKSSSMENQVSSYTRFAFAAALCAAIAETDKEAKFSVVAFDYEAHTLLEFGSKDEAQKAIAQIEPGGGTSYASGIGAAVEKAKPGSAIVLVGDYEDNEGIPPSIKQKAAEKGVEFYVALAGDGHRDYAEYITKEMNGKTLEV